VSHQPLSSILPRIAILTSYAKAASTIARKSIARKSIARISKCPNRHHQRRGLGETPRRQKMDRSLAQTQDLPPDRSVASHP
jgi:hypothetical protein